MRSILTDADREVEAQKMPRANITAQKAKELNMKKKIRRERNYGEKKGAEGNKKRIKDDRKNNQNILVCGFQWFVLPTVLYPKYFPLFHKLI